MKSLVYVGIILMLLMPSLKAAGGPLDTAFTYQGQVKQNGQPLNYFSDFEFSLWDDALAGAQVGSTQPVNNVSITSGLFTVQLNAGGQFGPNAFNGQARWLQIALRSPAGSGAFQTLSPRQPITATPYALYALNGPGGSVPNPLNLTGSSSSPIIRAENTNGGAGNPTAILGHASAGTGYTYGVAGQCNSPLGSGVGGIAWSPTGQANGVQGASQSSEGTGVFGYGASATGLTRGIFGQVISPDGYAGYFVGGRNYFQGNVGIGTPSPGAALDVNGTARMTGFQLGTTATAGHVLTANASGEGTWQPASSGSQWITSGSNIYYTTGNVGIGASSPNSRLQVTGSENDGTTAALSVRNYLGGTFQLWNALLVDGNEIDSTGSSLLGPANVPLVLNANSGAKVGIGTASPGKQLTVAGDMEIGTHSADYRHLRMGGGNSNGFVYGSYPRHGDGIHIGYNYYADAAGADQIVHSDGQTSRISAGYGYVALATGDVNTPPTNRLYIDLDGDVGIGTTNPTSRLTVQGNVAIKSASTGATVIELGEGLDYAEGFDVSQKNSTTPGTVLVLDPDNPGKLAVSTEPYDRKVAGIVAGANGLGSAVRLGAGQFDRDVALAGRVYCNVDATDFAVEIGDLLTTSTTPGHAMKATDHARAQGAILGKAMQKLQKGTKGQVLVLVTLQ